MVSSKVGSIKSLIGIQVKLVVGYVVLNNVSTCITSQPVITFYTISCD